jgi:Arc/MetJ family transcription regulator
MRTNIEISDELINEALSISTFKTKKKIVHEALLNYISYLKRKELVNMFGKVEWEGDLSEMRTNKRNDSI